MDGGLRGGSVGELAGWLAGWLAARPAGWWVGGWLAGRLQNAYRWRHLNKNVRFMQVLKCFLMSYRGVDFREQKTCVKLH